MTCDRDDGEERGRLAAGRGGGVSQGVAVWPSGFADHGRTARAETEPGDGIGGVDDRAIPAAAPAVRSSPVLLLCLCHYQGRSYRPPCTLAHHFNTNVFI